MQAVELLLNRYSNPKLTEPGPDSVALDKILTAGMRAPDHAGLKPWQFVIAQGDGLDRLGDIFHGAAVANGLEGAPLERAKQLPTRAPLVITVYARVTEHPKVPALEQYLSAGAALLSMQQMALALGFDGIWRTGSYATDPYVKKALGLNNDDEIVGFLYIGSAQREVIPKGAKDYRDHSRYL